MGTPTTHFGLVKPAVNSPTDQDLWGGELNTDLDTIDTQLFLAQRWVLSAKTLAYPVTTSDLHTLFTGDATTASFIFTLPTLASVGTGFEVAFKKTDATVNTVTVKGNGSELIDIANSYVLSNQNDVIILVSDATVWRVLSVANPSRGSDVRILQKVMVATGNADNTSLTMLNSPVAPLNTQGKQFMTLGITPKSITSTLEIEVISNFFYNSQGSIIGSVFQDTNVNALSSAQVTSDAAGGTFLQMTNKFYLVSGSLAATVFNFRAGPSSGGGTVFFNNQSGGTLLGNTLYSSIAITELG